MSSRAPLPRLIAAARDSGLFTAAPVTLARAPGRLDVMGGIADYTGCLVCELPLAVAAAVMVQPRDDGQVVCRSQQVGRTVRLPMAALQTDDPLALRRQLDGDDRWARYPLGCVWYAFRLKRPTATYASASTTLDSGPWTLDSGLTLHLDSDVPLGGGVSSSAAIEVATMTALRDVLHLELSPLELAVACQAVENRVVGAPCGVMDQVVSSLGRQDALMEILCQVGADGLPAQVLGYAPVPDGYTFVGLYSGVSHDVSGEPYTDTRVAAFMGRRILERAGCVIKDGHLANVPADQAAAWLSKLPEALTGAAFLDGYQGIDDAVTAVQPQATYHVRAATTHHVMEMPRVHAFIQHLTAPDDRAEHMRAAGALMYESHQSYGRRARLGHALTDTLVDLVRQRGPQRGFYGAKITGGGGGGTVAVLLRDEPAVRDELERLRRQYTQATGRTTILFDRSGPGAAACGTVTRPLGDLA